MSKDIFLNSDTEEISLHTDNKQIRINMAGGQSIVLCKLYGPVCFGDIRITPIVEEKHIWKIEKLTFKNNDDIQPTWQVIHEEIGGE